MDIWNPWHGCRRYSEGCEHCYMFFLDSQRDRDGSDIYKVKTNFNLPISRTRDGKFKVKSGSILHVCLTSDFFLEEADEWRADVWEIMRARPDVDFRILTKRAQRIEKCLPPDWGEGWENVTLSVTAENQKRADERLPILLELKAKHRGLMCAPLLTEIHIEQYLATGLIDSVTADGENYEGARPCHYEWAQSLSRQCREAGVPFEFVGTGNVFVKDGKTYNIPKAYQHIQALRSGLNYPRGKTDIPVQPRCAQCKQKDRCNGCTRCGKCVTSI